MTSTPNTSGTSSRTTRSTASWASVLRRSANATAAPEMKNKSGSRHWLKNTITCASAVLVSGFFTCQPHGT